MTIKTQLTRFASAGLLGLAVFSSAQAATANDTRQTQVLAGACANCHGTDGRLAGAIPAIAGRPAGVLEAQLLAFKQGQVPHVTVMDRIAKGYSDAELATLAQYFSQIKQ